MTLETLYRDIVSYLNAPKDALRVYDYIHEINNVISQMRVEYVESGLGNEFITTEVLFATVPDFSYPTLNTAELSKPLMRSLPIQMTVRQSLFGATCGLLTDRVGTFKKGDIVVKGGDTYEALEDIEGLNTYDATFEVCGIRCLKELKYKEGDVISIDGSFYRVEEPFEYDGHTDIEDLPLKKLYWRKKGVAFHYGTPVPFNQLQMTKLAIESYHPFSIVENVLYTPSNKTPITISYIPEWTRIEKMDQELGLSDSFYSPLKLRVSQILAGKLGIVLNQNDGSEGN